jgi:hypothetical protein
MDEIGQDPKLNARIPRGRWLDVAVAVALIAAAAIAVMTGRGSRPAASPAGGPGTAAAPALLPSTGRAQIPLPFGQPGGMTILGSTAWISDWSASQIVGVDLAARRVTRTLHVGDWQDEPVSMTSGAGSLWVLDFSGPLLRIDPASGAITKRFPVRGLGADVAYGDGFIWMITDEPAADGGQEYLYKIDPSRNVIVKEAPVPGAGQACAVSPGPQGIWIGCAGVDRITVINQRSLQPAHSLRVDSGGYIPQIVPGRKAVWVLTPSGLARADPATARITAIIRTGYAPSALSAPALIMDSADRLWITGSLLAVVVPGTLTAYPVARTPDLISAAADGPTIWVDTGSALVRLQADTPHATGATAISDRREAPAFRHLITTPEPEMRALRRRHIGHRRGTEQIICASSLQESDGELHAIFDRLTDVGRSASRCVISPRLDQRAHCRRSGRMPAQSLLRQLLSRSG